LVVGVIVFGMAAFMPFLVWKLMPVVGAAVVAQGVASGPARAVQQGMQLQFYGRQLTSGGRAHGRAGGVVTPLGAAPGRSPGGAGAAGTPTTAAAKSARLATGAVRTTADAAVDATAGAS
jgi:hypothetical protein